MVGERAMLEFECPICGRKVSYTSQDGVPWRPFCGQRCKAIDLGRWLNEEYRINEEWPDTQSGGIGANGSVDEESDGPKAGDESPGGP